MNIGIIGAGFTGLAAGYELSKRGHQVFIFESLDKPGGLAVGFSNKKWKFTLEKHYHHLFDNDFSILKLAKEIKHPILFEKAKTSTFYNDKIYQLDSPLTLLSFDPLSLIDKLRVGLTLLYLRVTNNWKKLENTTTEKYLKKTMGNNAWKVLWSPLMIKKFGRFYKQVAASWFWARIKKRSVKLGYPFGGFLSLAISIEKKIQKNNGKFFYSTKILKLTPKNGSILLTTGNNQSFEFDKVICSLPIHQINKLVPKNKQININKKLNGLGAINLILRLNKPFFEDKTYWLNINNLDFPFLAIVEHTNLVKKRFYNNEHILYIGNYLERSHPYFEMDQNQLFNIYFEYIKKINPDFNKKDIITKIVSKADFAQPVITQKYSLYIPKHISNIPNFYVANIQQVYPWDRGTNYAVEMGRNIAIKIINNKL